MCVCVCLKFCCTLGKILQRYFYCLTKHIGRTVWLFKRFKEGRISVGEDPRPGRTSTPTNDHVGRVHAVIRENHRLTVQEVADKVGISIGSCHQIFTEKPLMCPVSAKFVPHMLTDDQKENHVEICQELLANANGNENFLNNIITGMRHGFMGMMLKPRCNCCSGWGKGLLNQEKHGWASQRSRWWWLCFLIAKSLSFVRW